MLILSRVKDEGLRLQLELDDNWTSGLVFENTEEARAKQELLWLQQKNIIREYILVSVKDKWADLDDDMPF